MSERASSSLLARQLRILGLDGEPGQDDATESERIKSMPLKPLRLNAHVRALKRRPWFRSPATTGFMALAAGIMLTIFTIDLVNTAREDVLLPKGSYSVFLYQKSGDDVTRWEPGKPLASGDQVRIAVSSGAPMAAWYTVTNKDGKAISNVNEALAGKILVAGEKTTFPGSIKLVEPNEGETLNILVCEPDVAIGGNELENLAATTPKGCGIRSYKLR